MRRFLFLIPGFLSILLSPARAADPASRFQSANKAYDAGDFENAHESYLSIVEDGGIAPDLFYNLGNTAYRIDKAGEAALWYQRALVLDPSHAESRQNLRVMEREFGFLSMERNFFEKFVTCLSRRQILLFGVAGFWGIALSIAGAFAFDRPRFRTALIGIRTASAILLVLAVTAFLVRENDSLLLSRSIVTAPETLALTSPADGGKDVISLPPGTHVDLLAQRAAWSYVAIPGDLRGWVRSGGLTPLWPFDPSFLE